ncbi:MAG: hypothetical protein ACRD99_00505 [Nitrososphaera sp.]
MGQASTSAPNRVAARTMWTPECTWLIFVTSSSMASVGTNPRPTHAIDSMISITFEY